MERNYWNDPRVKVRPAQHEGWRIDEKRQVAYVTLPEECPLHDREDDPACALCKQIAALADLAGPHEPPEDGQGPAADEIAVPFGWVVCPLCEGKGTHTDPSIDCDGLTREDFDAEPDFAEDYFGGSYDVTCVECGGRRVVPELHPRTDEQRVLVKALERQEADEASYERMCRAERAMGA